MASLSTRLLGLKRKRELICKDADIPAVLKAGAMKEIQDEMDALTREADAISRQAHLELAPPADKGKKAA